MVARPRLVSARVCLPERRAGPSPYPWAKPARSISQAALVFDRPSGCGHAGAPSGRRSAGDDGVGEERTRAPRVVVVGVEDHPLAPAQVEHRPAYVAHRRRAHRARRRACGPARRRPPGAARSPCRNWNVDSEYDVATGVGLEPAGAVAEAAVGGGEGADAPEPTVPDPHRGQRLGHLLAVGADVLDRGGADRARDARQGLDPDPAAGDGLRDEGVPWLAGSDRHDDAAAGRVEPGSDSSWSALTPVVATSTTVPGEALVGDDDVAATGQDEDGIAGLGQRRRPPRRARRRWWPGPRRAPGPPRRSVVWSRRARSGTEGGLRSCPGPVSPSQVTVSVTTRSSPCCSQTPAIATSAPVRGHRRRAW